MVNNRNIRNTILQLIYSQIYIPYFCIDILPKNITFVKTNNRPMKVIDLIKNSPTTAFSFEVLPPLKGNSIEKIFNTIDTLREFDPKYINTLLTEANFYIKIWRGDYINA